MYHSHEWSRLVPPERGAGALLSSPTSLNGKNNPSLQCQGTLEGYQRRLNLGLMKSREEIQLQKEKVCVLTQGAIPGEPWAQEKKEEEAID